LQKTYLTYSLLAYSHHNLRSAHWGEAATDVSVNGSTYDRILELCGNTFELGAMPVRAGLAQSLHSLAFRPKAQRLTRYGETQG